MKRSERSTAPRRAGAALRRRGAGRRAMLLAALCISLAGVSASQAPPAAAACRGSGCNGLNPGAHCSATSTPREMFIDNAITLQLRYSSTCQAMWARAVQSCNATPPLELRVERQIYSPYGYYRTHVYYEVVQVPCNGNPGYTRMVGNYGTDRARSCAGYSYDGRPASQMPESWWAWCTTWF